MSFEKERLVYDKTADNIRAHSEDINRALKNCSIESKFATEETEEKLKKFVSISTEEAFKNEPSSEYYDLDKVSAMLEMLDAGKASDGSRKLAKLRVDSVSSLNSVNTDDENDNLSDFMRQLKEMRATLNTIVNTNIDLPNINLLSNLKAIETERNNELFELAYDLQKIAREIASIASTDKQVKAELSPEAIDGEFIARLSKLDECLGNMLELERNKNPIANVERREEEVRMEVSSTMNVILQNLKNHSL